MYLWWWSRWTPSNPLFLDPSFVTESRFGFVFLFNDHFVSSMSPSLCWKTDADASIWAKPSRQTAQQSWSSEQTGWVLPDGDLEGASCKTFVKQTKQGYTDLYKYEQGNCWPTYDQFAQTSLPVIHFWYDSCVPGLAGENRAQMEAADSTDLDWVTDGSKAGWTTWAMPQKTGEWWASLLAIKSKCATFKQP